MRPRLGSTRFDADPPEDPLAAYGSLVDVMLVFAAGLMAALVAAGRAPQLLMPATPAPAETDAPGAAPQARPVQRGRELPQVPRRAGEAGSGYESVGRVYRDARTGKLILIGD